MRYKATETKQCKVLVDESAEIKATINHSISLDVPVVIIEDEVEKLAKEITNKIYPLNKTTYPIAESFGFQQGFLVGFKEREQKGTYTEEDLRKAFNQGAITYKEGLNVTEEGNKFLQSLKQEYIDLEREVIFCHGNGDLDYAIKTDRDSNGQLIAYIKK